jgi:hypothetical protein
MNRTSVSPWAVAGLYLFAVTLVLYPVMDLATTVWPLRFADLGWRYGFLGLLAGYLHTPLLGLVLAMAVAYWQGHAGTLRAGGLVSLLGTVLLLIVMATFLLDVLAMREVRPEDARAGILVGGILQEVKYLGACLLLGCLGLGGVRTAQRIGARR